MARNEQPLHSRCDVAASPSAVRSGRRHAAEILAKWGVAETVAHDALLIVSELLSNAVQHAAQPFDPADDLPDPATCSLLLWLTENGLTVSVYDADRRPPVPRNAPTDAERGRGLHLVDALCEAWGYTHSSPAPGKLVWARLAVRCAQESPSGQRSLEAAARPAASSGVVMSA
ncbi:ATP-binding protein [Actinacidiphila acididurans]|uniref:ATP-binding protein n=1 Tax=Actinacidiphila acididurans TaxID=2784346 RepID=A0ABS2U3P8_9ACTN|nr:ATP-binding protein [Actinacidiphila acididurans]MBM9508763.1 ATP-binding protein [Actinacidiphila acididurans]